MNENINQDEVFEVSNSAEEAVYSDEVISEESEDEGSGVLGTLLLVGGSVGAGVLLHKAKQKVDPYLQDAKNRWKENHEKAKEERAAKKAEKKAAKAAKGDKSEVKEEQPELPKVESK